MTKLELCQRLRQEAGISGTGPAATTGQTGEMLRVVTWVDDAYRDVQNLHQMWEFLRSDFSFPTVASTQTYTRAAANLADLKRWKLDSMRVYLTSTGVTDEQRIDFVPWADFRDVYLYAANRSNTGRPVKFTVKPDKSLMFWPTPDAIYTVVGEYWKLADVLADNSDEPLFDEDFHMVIVWHAIRYYGAFEAAPEKFSFGMSEYERLMSQLCTDQLPQMSMGCSL